MYNNSSRKKIYTVGILILVLLLAGFSIKKIILGNTTTVNLSSAAPLVGQVAQSTSIMNGSNINTSVLNNFTLQNVTYYDNGTWALAHVTVPNNQADNGMVVMQKVGGFYVAVLGPGSLFPNSAIQGLPQDIQQYLNTKGYVYAPSS